MEEFTLEIFLREMTKRNRCVKKGLKHVSTGGLLTNSPLNFQGFPRKIVAFRKVFTGYIACNIDQTKADSYSSKTFFVCRRDNRMVQLSVR